MKGLSQNNKIALFVLLLCAGFLRLYAPLQYPLAINQDELNNVYDGWSIAQTGQDRWQTPNPFIVRGLGDGDNRPALQAYIIAAAFKITGYNVAVGRSINAVLALLSLYLLFLFLKNSFGVKTAFVGLTVGVFSSWHILFSRMAHEGAVLPFLFSILILYLWQKYRAANYTHRLGIFILAFVVGFSANAYQATKISALLFCIAITIDVWLKQKKILPILLIGLGGFLGAFPQLYTLWTNPDAFFARAQTQTIAFDSISSIGILLRNFALNFEPIYLFFSSGEHNNLSIYRLYPIETVFFYIGLILLVLNYKKLNTKFPLGFIAFAVFAVVLPAALTFANPSALRASGFVIFAPICTALGWVFCIGFIKNKKTTQIAHYIGLAVLVTYCSYTAYSYHQSLDLRNRNQQHYLVSAYQKLNSYKDNYPKIFIENTTGESYLYLISFCNIEPKEFQTMQKDFAKMEFDDFRSLGKYHLVKAENLPQSIEQIAPNDKVLIVSQTKFEDLKLLDSSDFAYPRFYLMEH